MPEENWERRVLERLAMEGLIEQRRSRRWGIFFKLFTVAVVVLGMLVVAGSMLQTDRTCQNQCTAMVDIRGELSSDGRASAENIIAGLQAAFRNKGTKGVILRINSPGGSPVQAGEVNDEIRRLRKTYPAIPIYAVVEELCASGAYYVAVATDRIYVDKASLIGSIGVIMDGFGFVGAMEKLGVERRAITAGTNKAFLDPFSAVSQEQRDFAQKMLDEIHQQFIDAVKQGRGERLIDSPEIFSGLVWNGSRGIQLGLADALGSVDFVAREIIKASEIVDFTPQENIAERVARRFGATLGRNFASTLSGIMLGR